MNASLIFRTVKNWGYYQLYEILSSHKGLRYTELVIIIIFFLLRTLPPGTTLEKRWSSLLRLQVSACNTYRTMCDVPSIAVFCSEFIEYKLWYVFKIFLWTFCYYSDGSCYYWYNLTFEVQHLLTSMHKLLYLNSFSASFWVAFPSAGIASSTSMHIFIFMFLIIMAVLFAITSLFVYTPWFHRTVTPLCSHIGLGGCVCVCVGLCTCVCVWCACVCVCTRARARVCGVPRSFRIE